MRVSEVMHAQVDWVDADTPVSEVIEMMKKDDIGAVPVGEDDRLVGMITDRDIALRLFSNGRDPNKTTARQVMTTGVIWCRSFEPVEDAIERMMSHHIRRLPVIDENKRLSGMLSLGDVSHGVGAQISADLLSAVSAHHA